MDDQFYKLGVNGMLQSSPGSPESAFIGKNILEAKSEVKAFNPETYISTDDPPFFIEHGTKGQMVPYLQSTAFSNALYKVLSRERVHVELLERVGHGTLEFSDPKNIAENSLHPSKPKLLSAKKKIPPMPVTFGVVSFSAILVERFVWL